MRAQYGLWQINGENRHIPDESPSRIYRDLHVVMGYRESLQSCEAAKLPPCCTLRSAVILWSGFLDNRTELAEQLGSECRNQNCDPTVVAAAYERWGKACFRRFIGDWVVSIWDPGRHRLLLAKDFIGAQPLFYYFSADHVSWSTAFSAMVPESQRPLSLEYLAGWISYFPAAHLTPFLDIHSVPPASYVEFDGQDRTVTEYWSLGDTREIHYRDDREYEDYFRNVFTQAVRRRVRSAHPVLAELSGGIDSSSIVCIADTLFARGVAEAPRLDTLSYYDDSEPNWDESPYFRKVEAQRGRTGYHIAVDSAEGLIPKFSETVFAPRPADSLDRAARPKELDSFLRIGGYRILLSGFGGDELLGGVPTPLPELADQLASLRLKSFCSALAHWALAKKEPILHLGLSVVRSFWSAQYATRRNIPPWVKPSFVQAFEEAFSGYESRLRFLGAAPSLQINRQTLDTLRRQLAFTNSSIDAICDIRYPYLDRDLVEFVSSIPREQVVRPFQRRSLMRRTLVGIVPDEILYRKRKAFVVRGPMEAVSREWQSILKLLEGLRGETVSMVDVSLFRAALDSARTGHETPMVAIARTLEIECWLRHLEHHGVRLTALRNSQRVNIGKSALFCDTVPIPNKFAQLAVDPTLQERRKPHHEIRKA